MTLPLTLQFGRAMKRVKRENKMIDNCHSAVGLWQLSKRHDETREKISLLTKKVKAFKAKKIA